MDFNVVCPNYDPYDSYGRKARAFVRETGHMGHTATVFSGDGYISSPINFSLGGIFFGYPLYYGELPDYMKIGKRVFVTTYETTKIPDEWLPHLNAVDAVIVGAQDVANAFRNSGITKPIYVVPLGVEEVFKDAVQRKLPENGEPFKFLTIGDRGWRKNHILVALAFNKAFGDDERYQLTIKARRATYEFQNPNITVLNEDYTDEQMRDLYYDHHVMVFGGREGFGLPPREFAATGGVTMALNWGGTKDEIQSWGIPIPIAGYESARLDLNHADGEIGDWAQLDKDQLAGQMALIANHFPVYAYDAIQKAPFVHNTYTWQSFARGVWDVYEGLL